MQKLTVERIEETSNKVAGFKMVMVRREVLPEELQSTTRRRTSFLGESTFEKKGRTALVNMSDVDIAKFNIELGVDLNEAIAEALGEQAVQVLETTDKNEFGADIALSLSEKINPEKEYAITHNGLQIYHGAILTPVKFFKEDGGDIRLESDQVVE